MLNYLNFCPGLFGHVEKRLDLSAKVNFKFLTSQPGKQTVAIHMRPKISRSKDNQTMNLISK